MTLEKIETETLRQKVYNQLRSKILGAELLPGEVISLRGLAKQFGVSLLPIREAVWQLESEDILVVESNKRIQVNHLTKSQFEEILNLRILLESEAVQKACEYRPKPAVKKVEKILTSMQKTVGVDHRSYIKKNDEFHKTIYSYAKSPLLLDLIQRLLARVNPYIYLYAIEGRDLSNAIDCHTDMFEGFASGDGEKTQVALKKDLTGAASVILTHLED